MDVKTNSPENNDVKLHRAHCDIWATPEMSSPDTLFTAGYEDEAIIMYLASVSPLYAAFSRILAQYSGILLLTITDTNSVVGLDQRIWQSAQDQLTEANARLLSVDPPAEARRHWQALNSISKGLKVTAVKIDHASTRDLERRKEGLMEPLKQLRYLQRLLITTAEPDANITPVDFESACCSCGTLSQDL